MSLERDFGQADRVADRLTERMIRRELLPAYRDSLRVIRAKVALLYERYSVDGELSLADVSKYNRLKTLEQDIAAELQSLTGKQVRITSKTITGVYVTSYYRAAFALEREVQVKLRFGLLSAKQVEAALVNPMDRVGWPARTKEAAQLANRQIREAITRGIIQGQGYPQVARNVKERLDIAAGRAERIVRTEAHRAREEGKLSSLEHAAQQGVELEKVWSATLDELTRSSHQSLDGQAVPMYDEDGNPGVFTSPSGATAEYPGGFGVPAEDINCRCGHRGQIKGYSPSLRRSREEGIIPYKTYKEWETARLKG